jgi:ubiquinone/menaquinone biosynthesis C-methylase UbiE
MSFYARHVLPRLTDVVLRHQAEERARLLPLVSGVVVEVGIGSALNIPFYGRGVEKLYGVDPSVELWRIGRHRLEAAPFPVEILLASAERIPLADGLADAVVSTWTLCTIPDAPAALTEMRRVLKLTGHFFFIEHGRAPEPRVQTWQDRLTPFWKRVAGGCHLNRAIDELIAGAGFELLKLDPGYASGPKPLAYLYRGVARRAP